MKKILKNLKTSVFGAVAGLPMIADGIANKNIIQIVSGIGALLVGLLAKDAE
jgi:hypothetical protein